MVEWEQVMRRNEDREFMFFGSNEESVKILDRVIFFDALAD
ncbi:hypothetical protein PLANPX_2975 [Lacipirellula parvula]|uniref:Uncharacterized protein n=1 Tax=Lacipirellula parvula TaxID=2650471 RepID=A0A5K7XGJ3_9BACT|nr:hypothetical protein PLANPX_2975 [Lacipirellula parvula]